MSCFVEWEKWVEMQDCLYPTGQSGYSLWYFNSILYSCQTFILRTKHLVKISRSCIPIIKLCTKNIGSHPRGLVPSQQTTEIRLRVRTEIREDAGRGWMLSLTKSHLIYYCLNEYCNIIKSHINERNLSQVSVFSLQDLDSRLVQLQRDRSNWEEGRLVSTKF